MSNPSPLNPAPARSFPCRTSPSGFVAAGSDMPSPREATRRAPRCAIGRLTRSSCARTTSTANAASRKHVSANSTDRKMQPARDATGKWRKKCDRFARQFGWRADSIWYWFDQIAAAREKESPFYCDRTVAEAFAFSDVVAAFDKRGAVPN